MSRGPGKWQRAILKALEEKDPVILRDLLPPGYKHADLSALYRAAAQLQNAGKVRTVSVQATWRKRYAAVTKETLAEAIEKFREKFGRAP